MANWQRKSEHLLRENVKFQTYVASLTAAQKAKEAFYGKKSLVEAEKGSGPADVVPVEAEPALHTTTV